MCAASNLLIVRTMRANDLHDVLAIQQACYGGGFVEGADLIARRLAVTPHTCWVAEREGRVQAYLAAYPSSLGKLTPLHGEFEVAPVADTLYLHDLAVDPGAAGFGLAQRLVQQAWIHAEQAGWKHSALVSVQSSVDFWQHLGYAAMKLTDPVQQQGLATYPGDSVYMTRRLD